MVKHRQGQTSVDRYVEGKTQEYSESMCGLSIGEQYPKGLDNRGNPSTQAIIQTGKQSQKGKTIGQSKITKAMIKTQVNRLGKTKITKRVPYRSWNWESNKCRTIREQNRNTEWLGKAANTWGVLNTEQYSPVRERKSKAYKECLMGYSCVCVISAFSCVCAISAMDDGKCSPVWCVVWESIWWRGDLLWQSDKRPRTGFVTWLKMQKNNKKKLRSCISHLSLAVTASRLLKQE